MPNPDRIMIAIPDEREAVRVIGGLSRLNCCTEILPNDGELLSHLTRFQPHLVLIDCSRQDSFTLCDRIKNDHNAMVVLICETSNLDGIDRAVTAGVDDFIPKPLEDVQLCKRVLNMLKLRHQSS
ncbi:response regulator [Rubripirellula obstinata]|nr:response regulator [Rubripirellula obstinata]